MNILEQYLQFLNEKGSKWKKMVSQGLVKDVEKLKPFAKSHEDYLKGVNKGTDEIIRKSKAEVINDDDFKTGNKAFDWYLNRSKSPMTIKAPGMDPMISIPKSSTGYNRATKRMGVKTTQADYDKDLPYIKRHEADEARAGVKSAKKYGEGSVGTTVIQKKNKLVGAHLSPEVLKKEMKLTNFSNAIYNDAQKLREVRGKTGEYEAIKALTNKWIRVRDRLNAKLRQKEFSEYEKKIAELQLQKTTGFLSKLKQVFGIMNATRKVQKSRLSKMNID